MASFNIVEKEDQIAEKFECLIVFSVNLSFMNKITILKALNMRYNSAFKSLLSFEQMVDEM